MTVDFNRYPHYVDKIEVTMVGANINEEAGETGVFLDKEVHGHIPALPNGWPVIATFSFKHPEPQAPEVSGIVIDTYGGIPSDYRGAIRFNDPRIQKASGFILTAVNKELDSHYSPHLSDEKYKDAYVSDAQTIRLAIAGALGYDPGLQELDNEG